MQFNKTSDVVVAKLYIPDTDEYSDIDLIKSLDALLSINGESGNGRIK